MKNNRILALLLAMVMVVGLLPMAALAATPTATVAVTANKTTVDQDDEITFTVSIQSGAKLGVVQLYPVIPEGLTYKAGSGKVVDDAKSKLGLTTADDLLYFEEGAMQLGIVAATNDGAVATTKVDVLTFVCVAEKGSGNIPYAVTMGKGDDGILQDVEYADADITFTPASVAVNKTKITPESLTLSYAGTLAITDKNFKGTAAATISGKDDEGDDLPASELAKVTYTVDKAWGAVAADGTVSIKDVAAAEAGDITVTAKLGTVTTTATVAVTKAAAAVDAVVPAASNDNTALIPTDKDSETYTYTVDVVDQYGAKMDGETVTWAAGTLPTGVTFDATTATLTVTKDAEAGEVTLTATVGGKSVEIKVNVTNITFAGVDAGVKAENGTYGAKLSDLVKVDASKITATAGSAVAGTYTLVDANTVPAAGDAAYKVVFNSTDGTYEDITVAEGTVAVAKKPITIKANDVTLYVGADVADAEYGYTATALVGDDALEGTATYTTYAMNEDGTKGEAAAVSTEEPADYVVEVSGLTASENYELTFEAGELSVKKKSSIAPAIGTGTKPGEATGGNGQNEPVVEMVKFEDVAEDDWFYGAVEFAVSKGLFKGTSETTFAPNANMNRAMVATVLFRMDGAEKTDVAAAFEDVEADTWYTDGVAWASEKEIVKGYSETVFAPNDNVTREQLAVMLYRYAGAPEVDAEMGMAGFNDVDAISEWAADAMRWAVQSGIIIGKDGAMLDPAGNATRAEVATMLQRFVNLEK